MAATMPSLGIDRLSVAERVALIDEIWDSLPDGVEADEVLAWHLPELAKRHAAAVADPAGGRPWQELLGELEARP